MRFVGVSLLLAGAVVVVLIVVEGAIVGAIPNVGVLGVNAYVLALLLLAAGAGILLAGRSRSRS